MARRSRHHNHRLTMPDAPPQPLLLIAPHGMLGRAWRELLDRRRLVYDTADRRTLDLAQPETINTAVTDRYAAVINCAAWTDVDGAESREAEATAVNGAGVGQLARRCAERGVTLVHYSTDYVFDGEATTPYRTDQPRDPLNAYGRSKAAGEAAIEAADGDHLILRTSWLYAPWGTNFVRTMARLTAQRDRLSVVADQRGRPTSCEHLADVSLRLLAAGARGTHHATDSGACSWWEFTSAIAGRTNPACNVTPCTSDQFPRPAKRPAYSVLDLSGAEAHVGPMPHWRNNLRDVLDRLDGAG